MNVVHAGRVRSALSIYVPPLRADMAGCKSSITGKDFYGTYDAQDLAKANSVELGIQV